MSELSEQQERFCRFIVEGKSGNEAYVEAGYKVSNDATARANASRLLTNANIEARIAELRKPLAEKMEITVETVTQMLREDRELARKLNQTAAAVSASLGIAKINGLIVDRAEVTDKTNYVVSNRPQTDEEWATDFAPAQRPN